VELLTIAVYGGALFISAINPGSSVTALVSRVITRGWKDVIPFITAMWLGEVIWLTMALVGLTALLQTFQLGFHIVKWLGIAYLGWLAVQMWRQPVGEAGSSVADKTSPWSMFAAGFAITMGNPECVVFYLAILPSLISVQSVGLQEWAILSCLTIATLATTDLTWTFLAHKARSFLSTPRVSRIANKVCATALGGAAIAMASRN